MHFAAEALLAKSVKEPSIFYAANVACCVQKIDAAGDIGRVSAARVVPRLGHQLLDCSVHHSLNPPAREPPRDLTDLATSASAAKCITASFLCCLKTPSICSRFPKSTLQNTALGGTAAVCPSSRLSSAITFIPRASKTSAQMLPM